MASDLQGRYASSEILENHSPKLYVAQSILCLKMAVFWIVAPCCLVEVNPSFVDTAQQPIFILATVRIWNLNFMFESYSCQYGAVSNIEMALAKLIRSGKSKNIFVYFSF
jgi:hypothetical protein